MIRYESFSLCKDCDAESETWEVVRWFSNSCFVVFPERINDVSDGAKGDFVTGFPFPKVLGRDRGVRRDLLKVI